MRRLRKAEHKDMLIDNTEDLEELCEMITLHVRNNLNLAGDDFSGRASYVDDKWQQLENPQKHLKALHEMKMQELDVQSKELTEH